MKTYELTYIISSNVTSEETEVKAKEIESAILGKEGIILKQSNPVAKTLSYPIGGMSSGFFGVLEFQLEPEKLTELKKMIADDEKIIRHILVIKKIVKIKKIRGSKKATMLKTKETELKTDTEKKPAEERQSQHKKDKVELEDIEQKLDEILGE